MYIISAKNRARKSIALIIVCVFLMVSIMSEQIITFGAADEGQKFTTPVSVVSQVYGEDDKIVSPTEIPSIEGASIIDEMVSAEITPIVEITPEPSDFIIPMEINQDITLDQDVVCESITLSKGTVNLNGYKLTVTGNVLQSGGTMNINGGTLDIAGDYKIENDATLKMTNEADYVKVGGNFTTIRSQIDGGNLTAGTLEIKGDFTQKARNYSNNFVASGTHKTVLSGSGDQKISFDYPKNSAFNELDISLATKVIFNTMVSAKQLKGIQNAEGNPVNLINTTVLMDKDITLNSGLMLENSSLNTNGKKFVVNGDFTLNSSGKIDINGGIIEVTGNVSQSGGVISINGGRLDIAGDYTLKDNSVLEMRNEADYVIVGGNFTFIRSQIDEGYLTAGTLEIKGNFTQKATNYSNNFVASGTHKTILSGSGVQKITFDYPQNSTFNELILTKYFDSGYVFNATPVWKTLTEQIKDTEKPTAPENLEVESTTENTVSLVWKASSDNVRVKGYEIYRDDQKIGTSEETKYVDTKLLPSVDYRYKILAFDAEGNKSDFSTEITARTKDDDEAPSAPNNLIIKSRNENSVTLSWEASTDNIEVKGYDIYRDGIKVGTSTTTNYSDPNNVPGYYEYWVKAFDEDGNYSPASNSVYFDNIPPSQPQDLKISAVNFTSVSLTWTESEDNIKVLGYEVYRNGSKVGSTDKAYYTDEGLNPGTKYIYTIKAYDESGNRSSDSEQAEAITSSDSEVPSVPTSLKATSINNTSITLEWVPSTDNVGVTGYEIFRNGVKVGTSTEAKYNDNGLAPNTDYEYSVRAYDFSKNFSPNSESIKVTSAINFGSDFTLSEDMTYGTVYLTGGTINLNGHKLTIKDSLYQTGGTMNINGGQLIIEKDYRIENKGSYVYAFLNMTKDDDYVKVGGTFSTYSYYNHKDYLTAGTMEVKGDFIQRAYYYSSNYQSNFKASGTHKVILSGDDVQKVDIQYPGSSQFNILEIKNPSSKVSFANSLNVNKLITNGYKMPAITVSAFTFKLHEDVVIAGDLHLDGSSIDLNGYTLLVQGSVYQTGGTMNINGGQLIVEKDYRIENKGSYVYAFLNMTKDDDYVKVGGTFSTYSYYNHKDYLTAGTMEVKGDFIQKAYYYSSNYQGNFKASGTHKVILSGDDDQKVDFQYPGVSQFNILEIKNPSAKIYFVNSLNANKLITNGYAIPGFKVSAFTFKLDEDVTVAGDLYLEGSTIDLNGYTLSVQGSMYQTGGTMNINGGQLIIEKDYRIENKGSYVYAVLNMTKDDDYVKVGGTFTTYSYNNHSENLTAGTLEVKGDFIQRAYYYNSSYQSNFKASGTHKVILSGDDDQKVDFQYPGVSQFNILEIKNPSAKISFVSSLNVNKLITNGYAIPGFTVNALRFKLDEDVIVAGDLNLGGSSIDINGYKLSVQGSVYQTGGTMNINGGQLIVEKDYRIENKGSYVSAVLNMTNDADYVKVGGTFTTYSYNNHSGNLTAGTMEVKGDFIQRAYYYSSNYQSNFKASGTHKVILSGNDVQKVDFQYPGISQFNIVEIKNPSAKISFVNSLNANKLITNGYKLPELKINAFMFKLNEDITIAGDLYLEGSVIDLNGYKLSVQGNVYQTGGTMYIDGGQLIVEKDYRIENKGSYVNAVLNMTKDADYVKVGGTFTTYSNNNHTEYLKAGIMEVKGDFIQRAYYYSSNYWSNFKASGTHKVILSGNDVQKVDFQYPANSKFNDLQITKPFDTGYKFNSNSTVWNKLIEEPLDNVSPTTPANLKVIDKSHNSITLEWEPSTDNVRLSGYSIYRDDIKAGESSTNRFTDMGLEPDTLYTYTVKAFDIFGNESGMSMSVQEATYAGYEPPAAPKGLVVISKSDKSISISWEAAGENGSIAGYAIYRDNKLIGTTTELSYTDNELIPATSYSYKVKAYDAFNNYSEYSLPLYVKTASDIDVPSTPGKPTVVNVTEKTVSITWEESIDNFSVAGYEVYRDDKIVGTVKDNTFTDVNLLPDTSYSYYVRAFDDARNYSSASEAVHAVTLKDTVPPTIPGNLVLYSKSATSVTLRWNKSTDNVSLKGYNIYRDGIEIASFIDKLEYTDSGLVQNKTYTYTVKAVDAYNNVSEASNEITVIPSIPDAPGNVIIESGVYKLDLSWDSVENEGVSYYKIYKGNTSDELYFLMEVKDGTRATIDNLPSGALIYLGVSAVDIWGNEGATTLVSGTTKTDTIPPQITSVQPTDGSRLSNRYVALKVRGTDNGIITRFEFESSSDSGKTWSSIAVVDAAYDADNDEFNGQTIWSSENVSGQYFFKVTAIDMEGNKSESRTFGITLDYIPPAVPEILNVTAAEGYNIIFWKAVGDEDVSRYRIYRKQADESFVKIDTVSSSVTNYRDYNSEVGKTYYYAVSSIDDLGNESALSQSMMATTSDYMPVLEINPVKAGPEELLTFNGKGFKPFEAVELFIDDVFLIDGRADDNGDIALSWKYVKNVTPGEHNFILKGTASFAQAQIGFIALVDLPSAPFEVNANPGQLEINLSWSASNSSNVSFYRVYRKAGSEETVLLQDNVKSLSIKDIEVSEDINYEYYVTAVDIYGNEGMPSDTVSAKPAPDVENPNIINLSTTRIEEGLKLLYEVKDNVGVTKVKLQYRKEQGEWKDIAIQDLKPQRNLAVSSSYEWNTQGIEDGTYEIKAVAYDAKGNYSLEKVIKYTKDTTPPGIPILSAKSAEIKVSLSWMLDGTYDDIGYYEVWRGTDPEDISTFVKIHSTEKTTYVDNNAPLLSDSFYYVLAVDKTGNKSLPSKIEQIRPGKDVTAPAIVKITPANNSKIGEYAYINVLAEDNVQVSRIKLQYSLNGTDNWVNIQEIYNSSSANFKWTTPDMDGNIFVRAIAYDTSGYESDGSPVRTYIIDRKGPAKVEGLKAIPSSSSIILNWNDVSDDDFNYFNVECKTATGEFESVGKVSNKRGIQINNLKPNTTYIYRVCAYDMLGNRGEFSDEIAVTTLGDITAPVVTYLGPPSQRYSRSISLSANIYDDVSVESCIFQVSKDNKEWTDIAAINKLGSSVSVAYDYNITDQPEGRIYIRCLAKDTNGNISSGYPVNEYLIDHTPPAKPAGVEVTPGTGYIDLLWSQGEEEDLSYYKIYRSVDDGEYTLIASNYRYLNYRNRDLKNTSEYRYRITAVDICGNESQAYETDSIQLLSDTEKPKILSVSYANNSTLPANPDISVLAEDNYLLKSIIMKYRKVDSSQWSDLFIVDNINKYSEVAKFRWNTSGLEDGSYEFVFKAEDVSGYESHEYNVTYKLDTTPPKATVVEAVPLGWKVELSWEANTEKDLAGYHVLRSEDPSGYFAVIKKTTSTSFTDTSVIAGKTYYYVVESVDQYMNKSRSNVVSAVPKDEDDQNPVAVIKAETIATTAIDVLFDSSLSTDNHKVEKVLWNFGDGTVSTEPKVYHRYLSAGLYSVSLAVYDSSGNYGTAEHRINIYEDSLVSKIKIKVVDYDDNTAISDAEVVVKLPDGAEKALTADANGMAELFVSFEEGQEKGTLTAYAFKRGYTPNAKAQEITSGINDTVTVKMKKGEVVEGKLTATRMTLDEIKAAGINVSAPQNQYVYSFNIHLGYNLYVNSYGQIGSIGSSVYKYTIHDNNSNSSTGTTRNVYVQAIPSKDKTQPPTIVYVELPGEAKMLKEFFMVDLKVRNLSESSDIILEDSNATLNVPSGLTLVKGEANQVLTPKDIPGGSTGQTSWIVRGDTVGKYDLSADFKGILKPFDEEIEARFVTTEPIVVEGLSKTRLIIEVENTKVVSQKVLYRVGLVNESSNDINRPGVSMKNSTFIRSYKTTVGMNIVNTSKEVLKPGEILWTEYFIDPDNFDVWDWGILGEYAQESMGDIPIEIVPVEFGTFGRVMPRIYKIEEDGSETRCDEISLIKYTSGKVQKMPDFKIKTERGISADVTIKEVCKLTIEDSLSGITEEVYTDANGEYIYKASIHEVLKPDSYSYHIKVTTDLGNYSTLRISLIDEENLYYNIEYNEITPLEIYQNDDDKYIFILGDGFNIIKDMSRVVIKYVKAVDGMPDSILWNYAVTVPSESIRRVDSKGIKVNLPEDIELGVYNLEISHPGFAGKRFYKAFEVSASKNIKKKGIFYYPSKNTKDEDYSSTYYYDDDYFSKDASVYDQSLATMSLCFALSAFASNVGGKTDYTYKYRNADDLLRQIGFNNIESNYYFTVKPKEDSMGVVVANKEIEVNGKQYTLVALATRGGGYEAEWAGNFTVGMFGQHEGFKAARDEAYRFLSDYVTRHKSKFKNDVKFWFAGFSRGGATVNMLAGKLIDDGQVSGVTVEKENLYAYCFEPPMGALKEQVQPVSKYSNIHNIVNPSDPVPKVAPKAWSFTRYGVDEYVIPSRLTYSNSDAFDEMIKKFKELDTIWVHESLVKVDGKDMHILDTFQGKKLALNFKPDFKVALLKAAFFGGVYWVFERNVELEIVDDNVTVSQFLDRLMTSLSFGLVSREVYTLTMQGSARLAAAEFMGGNYESYKWDKVCDNFERKVNENIYDVVAAFYLFGNDGVQNLLTQYLFESMFEAGINLIDYANVPTALANAIPVIVRTCTASLLANGLSDLITLFSDENYKHIFKAHYPELCLAWMQMQDENYGGKKYVFIDEHRELRVNCPVDVSVYNSKGTLVAQFINDVPQKIKGSTIVASFTQDGEKVVYLPADESYEVKIVATGEGTLNYSVSEYSSGTGAYTKIVNYYDIPITAGDELSGTVPKFTSKDIANSGEGSKVKYALSVSAGELTPSKELTGEQAQEAVYAVRTNSSDAEGGIVIGGGEYIEGSFAQVAAIPFENYEFDGWYNNDTMVSTDSVYRFQVKENISLIAKFNENRPEPEADKYSLKIEAGLGGSITKGTNGNYSEGEIVSITATPNSGYRFKEWISSNGGVFANKNNANTTFTMPANDTTIRAIFEIIGQGGVPGGEGSNTPGGGGGSKDPSGVSGGGGGALAPTEVSWSTLLNQINSSKDGDTITFDMKNETALPTSILTALKGKDVTIILNMGTAAWSINGKKVNEIPTGKTSYDLKVTEISVSNLSKLANGKEIAVLALAQDGEFPFSAALKWNVGIEHKGSKIYLSCYNETNKRLEYCGMSETDKDGNVEFNIYLNRKYLLTKEAVGVLDLSNIDRTIEEPDDLIVPGAVPKDIYVTKTLDPTIGAGIYSYVPYLIEGSKSTLIKWSSIVGNTVAFIIPKDGVYEYRDNRKEFNDISGHWAENTIIAITSREIFSGIGDMKFDPNGDMTRAMFATVLSRLDGADLSEYKTSPFMDVSMNDWYGASVAWANDKGIILGYGDGRFGPDEYITREQMAVMLNKYLKYKGITLPENNSAEPFADSEQVSGWAKDSVAEMKRMGLIQGSGDNYYLPKATANRASVAQILLNVINAVVENNK